MSPIKGLSELIRMPRLGKIHLGIKEIGEKGPYPKATDYFVCPPEVQKVFGEKPTELRVVFPTEDDSQWAQQWLKCYSATRGLICRGDGESAIARVDMKTGEIASKDAKETDLREITCNPAHCIYFGRKHCRKVMNLQFLLPECPGFGVYQIDTSSFNSIRNINSGVQFIRSLAGRVSMIPLLLQLAASEVTPEGVKKKIHVLQLTTRYTLAEVQRYAQVPANQALLPAPDSEAPDDLYPDELLAEPLEDIPHIDEALLQAWRNVTEKLKTLDIKDVQVSKWFARHNLDIHLKNFESPVPISTSGLTAELLSSFFDALVTYQEHKKANPNPNPSESQSQSQSQKPRGLWEQL